jgi:membrane protease subunit HflC
MMRASLAKRTLLLVCAGIGLLAISAVSVIGDREQAVIMRLGQPDRVVNGFAANRPGIGGVIAHLPFAERVVRLDRTLVSFKAENITVRSADQQRRNLALLGTYRITDPVRLVRTLGGEAQLNRELANILPALAQAEFGRVDADQLALPGGGGAWHRLAAQLDARARTLGVQVSDVRALQVALTEADRQTTFARMQEEREAAALSAADEGMQQALQIRSAAEVEAARIIGASAGRDPEFYDFYRAMSSYETMFADPGKRDRATLILSPDNAYLRQMNNRGGGR